MGSGDIAPPFLTSALVGREWSASRPCRFNPGVIALGTHWIGGWVDPRVGLDDVEKRKFLSLSGLELRTLGRPARSQSLYRLRYPGLLYGVLPWIHIHSVIADIGDNGRPKLVRYNEGLLYLTYSAAGEKTFLSFGVHPLVKPGPTVLLYYIYQIWHRSFPPMPYL
jgi:hypothetical protein